MKARRQARWVVVRCSGHMLATRGARSLTCKFLGVMVHLRHRRAHP